MTEHNGFWELIIPENLFKRLRSGKGSRRALRRAELKKKRGLER